MATKFNTNQSGPDAVKALNELWDAAQGGVGGGGLSPDDRAKLDSVAIGATANSTDASLRNRANHTGLQAIATVDGLTQVLADKQPTLVSAQTIKTINDQSILGSGNLTIMGAGGGGGMSTLTPKYLPTLGSIDECRLLTGPYANGYVVAPAGYLNVYFAAIALLGVLEERLVETKAFLTLVLDVLCVPDDGLRGRFVIYDAFILPTPGRKDPDSNDSYGAITNTLAYRYAKASGDWAWYASRINLLKDIAFYNNVSSIKPAGVPGAGMVRTFQTTAWGPYYEICLTEDNCEVYEGMDALSKGLAVLGLAADSTYYANVRNGIGLSMHNPTFGVWNEAGLCWATSDGRAPFNNSFYADAVTQVFPELFHVSSGNPPLDRQRYDYGWVKLNEAYPQWELNKPNDFPWMLLSTAAARRGAFDQAEAHMATVRRRYPRGVFTINEAGWQRMTEKMIFQRGLVSKAVAADATDLPTALVLINQLKKLLLDNGVVAAT